MTIVVGLESPMGHGGAFVAADRLLSDGNYIGPTSIPKIMVGRAEEHRSSTGVVVGFAGPWRAANLVRYALATTPPFLYSPAYHLTEGYEDRYMESMFMPWLEDVLERGNAIVKKDDDLPGVPGMALLVAVKSKVFMVGEDLAWSRSYRGYEAVGDAAARGVALGSLYATRRSKNGARRVKEAMAAAQEHVPRAVLLPYDIECTT